MTDIRLNELARRVEAFYRSLIPERRNADYAGHWWDHIVRVTNNATLILKEARHAAKPRLIVAASLCHDLGYAEEASGEPKPSLDRCRELLEATGYSRDEIDYVTSLIIATDRDLKRAETVDERIAYVADKLDLFGVAGTIRLIIEYSRTGLTVRHEVAQRVREHQADWFAYMISFGIAEDIIRAQHQIGAEILNELSEPSADI